MDGPAAAHDRRTPWSLYAGVAVAVTAALVAVRYIHGYLLFHSLVEIFAVAIAAGMFMITWNLRRFFDAGYLIVLGVGFFAAACVDVLHTLAYSGMGVFPDADANLPTQLWLIARYLQAAALVIAPAYARRTVSAPAVLAGFAVATAALLASVFVFDVFPAAFVEGVGLTPFKIYSEYAISAAMLVGLIAVRVYRDAFPREVYLLLSAAIVTAIASELSFTLYTDPEAIWNLIGHVLKIATFFLLYRAVVETVLVRPFDVLFGDLKRVTRELSESEERFRATFEQAATGMAHIDLNGQWMRFNDRLLGITGYQADELEYLRPDEITHPEDRPRERARIERLVNAEVDEYRIDKRLIAKDGSIVWVEAARTLLHDAEGAPLHFIATFEQIDDRKAEEEALRRSRDLTEAVTEIDAAMNASSDVSEVLRIAADRGARALGADSAVVFTHRDDTWLVAHCDRFPGEPSAEEGPWTPLDEGSVFACPDVHVEPCVARDALRRWDVRALLGLTLRSRGSVLGIVYYNYHSAPHRFSAAELSFADTLAKSITVAIESARLFESQRAIADTLQAALLSLPDEVPGLEIAHAYRSAAELARIGGDFYDVFEVAEETVAFVLGDVSGKGLEASTLTALAKSTVRAFAYQDHRPAHVMASANAAIASQIDESRFITAVYGTIDMRSGCLTMVCAGHPPPFICIESQCIEHNLERFPPLGVVPDASFTEFGIDLTPDTLVVLFSDGLIEARDGSVLLGEERVGRIVESSSDRGPQAVVDALIAEAERHTGGDIGDDVAIVVLRYLGREANATA